MYKPQKLLTIKEWSIEKGLKVIKPNGFRGKKNKTWNNLYTENQFKKGLEKSYITVNTEKGLAYLGAR